MIVMNWTDAQVDCLRTMWPAHSARDIAAEIGATRDAVLGKARRLGLPSKCITTLRRNELQKAKVAGDIIEPLNVSFARIGQHQCRWITNDDKSSPLYCAHDVVTGTDWCPSHYVVVYQPISASKRVGA